MRPPNSKPAILLGDGAPVRCNFAARADAPVFWEDCEQDATTELGLVEKVKLLEWRQRHPKAIVWIRSHGADGKIYLCDAHAKHAEEMLG